MQIKFTLTHPKAKQPMQGSATAAGWDLFAADIERVGSLFKINTGLQVEIPQGYHGKLYARSSLFSTGLEKIGGVCVIDNDYRGDIFIMFREYDDADEQREELKSFLVGLGKTDKIPLVLPYEVGDRVAQLVIEPQYKVEWVQSETLSQTERGTGGYGSTGVK